MMRKVLEKFKNKQVFALYLIGVLLLSTGISFAYFTARTNAEGEGGVATATTTTVTSQGITADGNIDFNNVDMYPGHTAIASIRVTGTGNNEPLMYNVIFNGSSTFTTPLNYTVYKSDANIDASYSCEIKQDRLGTSKIYYEECTGNNIENLGTPISRGTINNGEGKTTLKSDEIILTSPEGEEVYYYIVIEYPNLDANQNDDMGSSISGNITIEEGSEYQKPQVILTGSTTAGSNGWVQSASITTNITTHTGKYEAYYCTTTSDSCTPNTLANGSNNSFTTTLSSSASAQKVCVRVVDEYNQTAEGCSERYSVDTVNPTVSITSTSATTDSISVTVNGTDAHSGISGYRFSSNGGSSYTGITTTDSSYTYTFNNLESGTSYNIKIEIIDNAGNIDTVVQSIKTKSIYAKDTILANYSAILTRTDFSSIVTATTTGTIYKSVNSLQYDNDGEVYYFAGNPTDNWVRFAGFYWRIIRINGDKSIRLIYNGTSTATTGTSTQLQTTTYNRYSYNDNAGVGYMYGTTGSTSYSSTHANINSSTIKLTIDSWYKTNIVDKGYSNYVSQNTGFCNDRYPSTNYSNSNGLGGTGTTTTFYASLIRLYANDSSSNASPSFKCINSNDLFTVSSSNQGNKALTYPVGLITADEVAYAGGVSDLNNTGYYLYTKQDYWTMTPAIASNYAQVNIVASNGWLHGTNVANYDITGARPVINLRADVQLTGTGTMSDPYVVVE